MLRSYSSCSDDDHFEKCDYSYDKINIDLMLLYLNRQDDKILFGFSISLETTSCLEIAYEFSFVRKTWH